MEYCGIWEIGEKNMKILVHTFFSRVESKIFKAFGGVLDGKIDTSKKDRTSNAGRKISACVGRPVFFRRVFFSIKNSPIIIGHIEVCMLQAK